MLLAAGRLVPLVRPFADGVDGGSERASFFRERVLDADGRLGDDGALDDPLPLELLQALAEHAVRDAGDRIAQGGVAAAPAEEQEHDRTRPPATDELDCLAELLAKYR